MRARVRWRAWAWVGPFSFRRRGGAGPRAATQESGSLSVLLERLEAAHAEATLEKMKDPLAVAEEVKYIFIISNNNDLSFKLAIRS